jgi:hypothetical protein
MVYKQKVKEQITRNYMNIQTTEGKKKGRKRGRKDKERRKEK